MQPRELIIEGLTAFTQRVTLRFDDVTLFALVGPTGAGKSSVVDAITLALYGRVPRLHANEIAPAISSTASECTVGLTFTVRGRPYRAVRTIRRTKTGASTLEAALEQLDGDEAVIAVLAGTADDVTAEVERLVGLTFNEFTRAVVLPQGQFAKVLRAQPKDRQALLSRLLGVGIYDRVKQRAGHHARAAQERAEQTAHQLAQLGPVDAATLTGLDQRVASLDAVLERLTEDTAALLEVRDAFKDAQAAAKTTATRVQALRAITPPPAEVREHGDREALAVAAVEKATAASEATEAKVAAVEERQLPAERLQHLASLLNRHQRTPELVQAVEDATSALEAARAEVGRVATALTAARSEAEAARAAQRSAHREHAAVQAVDGLGPGDDCPVCATALTVAAPALAEGAGAAVELDTVSQRVTDAVAAVGSLEGQRERAGRDVITATEAVERVRARLTEHRDALDGQPTPEEITAALDTARQLADELSGLRQEAKQSRRDLDKAARERQKLAEQGKGLSAKLDRLRLAVGELDPPVPGDDVAEAWATLHAWATARLPAHVETAETAAAEVQRITEEGSQLRERMERACTDAGVPDVGGDPKDRAVQHRATLVAEREKLAERQRLAEGLRKDEAEAREQAAVGGELARLLRTDQFQRWLLDEATRGLVAGASAQLRTLSRGRYELMLDGGNGSIQVVDLSSAGAPRSVRTLSGGETFLASLALALSLAEQIAVSASGPVALESLFIDEGFGALDPETLDVAAGAIEQLGTGDRTVGVISHVTELAERLPTRYVVQRTASGSRVERVDL